MPSPDEITHACERQMAEMDGLLESLSGSMEGRTLTMRARGIEDEELHERVQELYFDFPFMLGMSPEEIERYRLELQTPEHHYVLDSRVDLLPDTGGGTREGWQKFLEQFVYLKDGQPQDFPVPDDFPED